MILLSIGNGLSPSIPSYFAAGMAWISGTLLFPYVRGIQRVQIIIMGLVGICGLAYTALSTEKSPDLIKALSVNQALLSMLAAVTFLRLIAAPRTETGEELPTGYPGFIRTLFGVHFFGAIINLSAVMIVGDKLSQHQRLSDYQAAILSRGFALAAHWSPFFAAMGIALTNAPGSELPQLTAMGFPLAVIGLGIAFLDIGKARREQEFVGYPWHFGSLWIPALLAAAVMVTNHYQPQIPILSLIALFSVGLTLLTLFARRGVVTRQALLEFIPVALPRMGSELLLFLAAGILAVGLSSVISAHDIILPIDHFGPTEAGMLLVMIIVISYLGIHPVISISTAGSILMPIVDTPNLLALTFLMSWALSVTTSPFSAMHLSMQGRYGIQASSFLRNNLPFALLLLLIQLTALHTYF